MVDADPQHTGQSNYSTSSNYGQLIWKFESKSAGVAITYDWFFQRPLVTGANDTVIFEDGGSLYAVQKGALVWQYHVSDQSIGFIHTISPPYVGQDGTIYVGGHDKYLHALDMEGHLLWKYDAGNFIDSTPVVGDDGTIYVGTTVNSWDEDESLHYYLHAVNPDGTMKWKVETGPCTDSAVVMSRDGTIYLVSGADETGWDQTARYLYSIDQNGSVNWIRSLGDMSFLHPAVSNDGTVYLITDWDLNYRDYFLMAIRPDGSLAWQLDVRSINPNYAGTHGTPPVVADDGTLYFGFCNGIAAVGSEGTIKWNYTIDRGLVATPAISKEGTIIFGSIGHDDPDRGNYGYLFALNPDGTLKWKVKNGDCPHSNVAIGEDGTIYFAATGNVYALNGGISPEETTLLTVGIMGAVITVLATLALMTLKNWRKNGGRSDL